MSDWDHPPAVNKFLCFPKAYESGKFLFFFYFCLSFCFLMGIIHFGFNIGLFRDGYLRTLIPCFLSHGCAGACLWIFPSYRFAHLHAGAGRAYSREAGVWVPTWLPTVYSRDVTPRSQGPVLPACGLCRGQSDVQMGPSQAIHCA